MIVQCPNCDARYRVNDAAVPATGGKITCPSCQHKFIVYPERAPARPHSRRAKTSRDGDKTSVTQRPDLAELLQKTRDDEAQADLDESFSSSTDVISATEVVETDTIAGDMASPLAKLRSLVHEDGTVEMKNPFLQGGKPAPEESPLTEEMDLADTQYLSEEDFLGELDADFGDDLNAAMSTEVLSDADLEEFEDSLKTTVLTPSSISDVKLPSAGGRNRPNPAAGSRVVLPQSQARVGATRQPDKKQAPGLPRPLASSPTGAPFAPQPTGAPSAAPRRQTGPQPTSAPSAAPRRQTGPQQTGASSAPQQTGASSAPQQTGASSAPQQISTSSAPQQTGASSAPQQTSTPRRTGPQPVAGPSAPTFPAPSSRSGGFPAQPAREAPAAGPDAAHEGPWKLKTNFGLTYEFADNKSLKNWLAGRDDLEGFELAGSGEFFKLMDWPQVVNDRRLGARKMTMLGMGAVGRSDAPVGQAGQAGQASQPGQADDVPPASASGDWIVDGARTPSAGARAPIPTLAPSPEPASWEQIAAMDTSAPSPTPASSAAPGKRINPADTGANAGQGAASWLLWPFAGVLFAGVVLLAVDIFGIYDIKGAIFGEPSSPVSRHEAEPVPESDRQPQLQPDRQGEGVQVAADEEADQAAAAEREVQKTVDRMLTDAREAIEQNRLQSANTRLNNAKLLSPERAEIYELLENVFEQMGRQEDADAAREKAATLREADGQKEQTENTEQKDEDQDEKTSPEDQDG